MSPSNESVARATNETQDSDPRHVEILALREFAHRMRNAQKEPVCEETLLHTIRLNWRLWTIFQVSLLEPDCPLPAVLRNNILSLSNFIDKHSADIIAAPAPGKLDVLIRINLDLAEGLSGALTGEGGAAPACSPQNEDPR